MHVTVLVSGKGRKVGIKNSSKISDLMERMDINPETVIVLKGDKPVPDTERLKQGDKIRLIDITSGG